MDHERLLTKDGRMTPVTIGDPETARRRDKEIETYALREGLPVEVAIEQIVSAALSQAANISGEDRDDLRARHTKVAEILGHPVDAASYMLELAKTQNLADSEQEQK